MAEAGSDTSFTSLKEKPLSKERKLKASQSSYSLRSVDSTRSKRSLRFKQQPAILQAADNLGKMITQMSSTLGPVPQRSAIKQQTEVDTDSEDEEGSLELRLSSDTLSSAGSFVHQNEVEMPPDFFEELGEIPSVNDLSEDSFELDKTVTAEPSKIRKSSLDGNFVDPLTGSVDSVVIEEPPSPSPEPSVEEEATPELSDNEDLLVLLGPPEQKDEELAKVYSEEEAFETFLDVTRKTIVIEDDIDFAAIEREARELRTITAQFLDKLITQIVEVCEWIDPKEVLREQLDKKKLMSELIATLKVLEEEQRKRAFLNRKTVEFFRRKKAFRSISDDNPATVTRDEARYQEALVDLDNLIGRETELHEVYEAKMRALTEEHNALETETETKVSELEDLMRRNAGRENSESMQMLVNRLLSEMAGMRKQVSEVRFTLVLRQHAMAQLVEKTKQLEDLGEGLRMVDFERLQTEVQALDKKVEERNSELDKLHLRCNSDINVLAHLAEKETMLKARVNIQKTAFQMLKVERYSWREQLYKAKMQHSKITKEIRELSFQCGLLDKPALMADFDETADQLDKRLANVEIMRATYVNLLQQIESAERKCQPNP